MNTYTQLILILGVMGLSFIVISFFFEMILGIVGGFLCILPAIIIYTAAKRTGALMLMVPQTRGDVLIFYISGTRRIFPLQGKELLERYVKIVRGYGRIRVTKNSDYLLGGKKVLFAKAGVAHSIPIEMAAKATELRRKGYTSYDEAKAKELRGK